MIKLRPSQISSRLVFTKEPERDIPAPKTRCNKQINVQEITKDTVQKNLSQLKVSKSPGPDNLQRQIISEMKNTISTPLAKIFSTSLDTRKLPLEWKCANITAIYKKSGKEIPENYRPISLTSIVDKIMESIIRNMRINHMKSNKLYSARQYGFMAVWIIDSNLSFEAHMTEKNKKANPTMGMHF